MSWWQHRGCTPLHQTCQRPPEVNARTVGVGKEVGLYNLKGRERRRRGQGAFLERRINLEVCEKFMCGDKGKNECVRVLMWRKEKVYRRKSTRNDEWHHVAPGLPSQTPVEHTESTRHSEWDRVVPGVPSQAPVEYIESKEGWDVCFSEWLSTIYREVLQKCIEISHKSGTKVM